MAPVNVTGCRLDHGHHKPEWTGVHCWRHPSGHMIQLTHRFVHLGALHKTSLAIDAVSDAAHVNALPVSWGRRKGAVARKRRVPLPSP